MIDGNSICYRAFYAIKDLKTSKGQPTNAIYGFILMLRKLLADEKPDYLAVAFDLKGPTFRHKRFKEYKIKRKPMPDDLVAQIPLIKDVLRAFNIAIFEKEGFEADDIIATIAGKASKEGLDVYIVTGDKDAFQLIDDRVKVYSTHKDGFIYDREAIMERFSGLEPSDMVDFMALAGDQTDNIPGVRGIGEKLAIDLIKEFKTIENLYKNLDTVESKAQRKLLEEGEVNARMSKELAAIDASVPLVIDVYSLKARQPDGKILFQIFKELEFKSLAKEMASDDSDVRRQACYKIIVNKREFEDFVDELKKQKEFVLDIGARGANPLAAAPAGISFCWEIGKAYYVALIGDGRAEKGLDIRSVLKELKGIMEDGHIKKIGQNIKYEKLILSKYSIELNGICFDTMIASYLLNPSKASHDLEALAFEHFDHKMVSSDEFVGTGKSKISIEGVPLEEISAYSCEDVDVTLRLKYKFEEELFEKELKKLFEEIELPLIDVIAEMEKNGVKIDALLLKEAAKDMAKRLDNLVEDIYKEAGFEFNINSPKQLSEVLFGRLNLPVIKKTKSGFSTDMAVLERLSFLHPLPKKLLHYRELSKLKSTYIDTLPELVNPETGRLHTSFNQAITATGRLSSSNPNLQNIPIKTEEGRKIRKAFIGEGNRYIMSADYSQIELRILAHLSKDPELIAAFERGRDVHAHTASLIFGVDEKDVTAEMRTSAKTVNFGIVYGMSAFGLSRNLSIDPQTAQQFIDSYFERYPYVKLYMEERIDEAKDMGYVVTLFNRRRYIPEITSGSIKEQQQAERIAINTPIQGSAADLIKIAMIDIHREIKRKGLDSMMVLQVHDELVFEVPKKEMGQMYELVKGKMEGVVKLLVPIEVDIKYGKNWLELEEYKWS